MTPIAIELQNISKRFFLHSEKPTLSESLNPFQKPVEYWALKNINLTIHKGEHIGFVGPNGSGKSTLLKIISGITKPTTGTIRVYGNVISLIEIGAGFQPDMNGIDNIYLNGMLLGLSKDTIKQKIDKIIEFADIGSFIYQPFFTYSSGMALRLGFSIAISANPEILILDEHMSVGDHDFQLKSFKKIEELSKTKSITLICASHHDDILRKLHAKLVPLHNNLHDLSP